MERIFDLPAHPLLVHFPVVAIPVLCIMAILMAVSPQMRRKLGLPTLALGAACLVATLLATNSGEALVKPLFLESVIKEHRELGQTTQWLVILLFVFLCVQFAVGRSVDKKSEFERPALAKQGLLVLSAVVVVLSVLSTVWVVRTGHEGAKVTWAGQLPPEQ